PAIPLAARSPDQIHYWRAVWRHKAFRPRAGFARTDRSVRGRTIPRPPVPRPEACPFFAPPIPVGQFGGHAGIEFVSGPPPGSRPGPYTPPCPAAGNSRSPTRRTRPPIGI